MTNAFICYARENQEQVKSLVQDLEDLGRAVWFDQALTGGQVWWDQILLKIRECGLFVVALSPASLASQACTRELGYATSLGKTILPVAVAAGVTDALLPEALARIQYVDYQRADKAALRQLSKALLALPPSGPLPPQLPAAPAVPISYLVGLREQIETPEQLPFDHQTALVLRLKQRLHEAKDLELVTDLLRRLRSRDDLYAKVGDEIDSLLAGVPAAAQGRAEAASPAPPTPAPRPTSAAKTGEPGSEGEERRQLDEWLRRAGDGREPAAAGSGSPGAKADTAPGLAAELEAERQRRKQAEAKARELEHEARQEARRGLQGILPGSWQVEIVVPYGVSFSATFAFDGLGNFNGQILNPVMGMTPVQGRWSAAGDTLTLQGQQMVAFMATPYFVVMQFSVVQPRDLRGTTGAGEQVTFRKVG